MEVPHWSIEFEKCTYSWVTSQECLWNHTQWINARISQFQKFFKLMIFDLILYSVLIFSHSSEVEQLRWRRVVSIVCLSLQEQTCPIAGWQNEGGVHQTQIQDFLRRHLELGTKYSSKNLWIQPGKNRYLTQCQLLQAVQS